MDILETERLILDKWSRKDAHDLFAYASTPNVGPLAGWEPHKSISESRQRIKRIFIPNNTWKITMKGEGTAIGSIGFEPDPKRPEILTKELGYSLAEPYWGMGIMTEAGQAVIKYGFEVMDLRIISIETAPDNLRSQRVIEKLGFKFEGNLRESYQTFDGIVRDTYVYSILRREWEMNNTI